jgi:hypothetical protein
MGDASLKVVFEESQVKGEGGCEGFHVRTEIPLETPSPQLPLVPAFQF